MTSNKIYVANCGSSCGYDQANVTVLDGATNSTTTITVPYTETSTPSVNPVTNMVYVANLGNVCCGGADPGNVMVISEQQVQPIPLVTAIAPLPGNQTANPTPTFDFATTSSFSPYAPTPQAVWYQVDTRQAPWLLASGAAPDFTGTTPSLLPGTHILYAFATDGQDATSTMGGVAPGSLIGNIAAYQFDVLPTNTTVTLSPTSLRFGNQSLHETSAAKTVTLTNTGTATLTIATLAASANFAVSSTTCGATLAVGKTCKVSVTFTPTALGTLAGTLTLTDNAPNSPQAVALSGTGIERRH